MKNIVFLIMRRMRLPLIVLISAYAFAVLGFVLIPGENNLGEPYRMDFFHAFYFVSFMGSTIGFGEIPYEFTGGQRMWAIITIYSCVISWLYAIGALISLIQTRMFHAAVVRNAFVRNVRRIREPFYLVCGYGDTGERLVAALSGYGLRCVVVDQSEQRIIDLDLENLPYDVPSLNADAGESEALLDAGLGSSHCAGVVAVSRDDQINLKIAIAAKLLNPNIKVFCWTESHDTGVNMASFETDHIIYPYDIFAEQFAIALKQPSHYLLRQWLTSPPGTSLSEPVFPPQGRWILCGYGRFGKAVHQQMMHLGIEVSVIEEFPEKSNAPEGTVTGRGTEAETLHLADIKGAAGIIAGTDHDVNNLSIILTARATCPEIFTVARQGLASNERIFAAAGIDLIFNHSQLISRELLSLITAPTTADFLKVAAGQSEEWARLLVCRLLGCSDENDPDCWTVTLRSDDNRAIANWLDSNGEVQLHHLMREPGNRKRKLPCVSLLLVRGKDRLPLPDVKTVLEPFDQILFAGQRSSARRIDDILTSPELLHYMVTGENRPAGVIWRWINPRIGIEKSE